MNFLKLERSTLKEYLFDLDDKLSNIPFLQMESPGNPSIAIFRNLGGPGLLVPTQYGGKGITPLEAVRIQRAIASRSPSLAIATTMHHFTVATIMEMITNDADVELLKVIACHNMYLASGFAEGKTETGILNPDINATRTANGIEINGSKKPCSLSLSMDFLTVSAMVPKKMGEPPELALVVIPAKSPGVERRSFWSTSVLGGAESDEVILNNVKVHEESISYMENPGKLDSIQAKGFIWFELLISASYLGIVSGLVERVFQAYKGIPNERNILAIEVEGAMVALEGIAYSIMNDREHGEEEVARTFFVRFSIQRSIERCLVHAAELLGGIAFISSSEIPYLMAAARALAFHPPSRLSVSTALDKYLYGKPLII